MPLDRRKQILELLDETGSVSLNNLSKLFPDVSIMTLRRDLTQFENEGMVIRTHGGAVKANKVKTYGGDETAYEARENEHLEAKRIIAKKALPYIETGRSIYLDSGSTIMSLVDLIPDDSYSIITSGVNIAQNLLEKEKPSVIVLGGFANRNTLSMSGPLSSDQLDRLNIDVAFISASGFSTDHHFTVSNIYEAELKTKILKKAKKVIVLVDSSKFGKSLPYTFATLSDIDLLITETELPVEIQTAFQTAAIAIL
ncbi:MAG: DeoR/GlpR transcriptional regulator [Vallitaleaceae bacterium]|nr:DeoR/GlpR transcriptional regulator [Vallitaleaceae bacterium]